MKKKDIVSIVNRFLTPFDAKLIRASTSQQNVGCPPKYTDPYSMEMMIKGLRTRVDRIGCVVDIGASNGKWSLLCHQYFPEATYLAIEPLQERKVELEQVKSMYDGFEYSLCVAGKDDGQQVCLNVTADLDGSAVDGQNAGVSRMCPVRSIDSLIAEFSMQGPYLLKFDTHGYELPILDGALKTLTNTAAIIMEVYNYKITSESLLFYEMCAYLAKKGYRPADIADPLRRPYDGAFWQVDILFLRADAELFVYQHYT